MSGVELPSSISGGTSDSAGGVLEPNDGAEEEAGVSLPEIPAPPERRVGFGFGVMI